MHSLLVFSIHSGTNVIVIDSDCNLFLFSRFNGTMTALLRTPECYGDLAHFHIPFVGVFEYCTAQYSMNESS